MLRYGGGGAKAIPALPCSRAVPCTVGGRRHRLRPRSAKKPSDDDGAGGEGNPLVGVLSKRVLLRSGLALFALGFVDAGYSGDWSRIGAISGDTEEALKLGAYAVVPLCVALAFSVPEDSSSSKSS